MRLRLSSWSQTSRPGQLRLRWCLAGWLFALPALAGTFGTVVPIGGHASDVALDEKRGLLYVANMTGNRVDVVSTQTKTVLSNRSFNVPPYPNSVSLSPNGRFLVVTHYRNFPEPTTWSNVLTIYDLEYERRRTLELPANVGVLGVSFGYDNRALIATTSPSQSAGTQPAGPQSPGLLLLEPDSGTLELVTTWADVTAKQLPVEWATFPPQIHRASLATSGDGQWIWGVAEWGGEDKEVIFRYNVATRAVELTYWTSQPPSVRGP